MLKRFLSFVRAPFSWTEVGQLGANTYLENTVTGERRMQGRTGGFTPLDRDWLSGREDDLFRDRVHTPPRGGSAVSK